MARLHKRILTVLAILLVILSISLIVGILTINLDRYRPQLEQGLSRALGVEVNIGGRVGLTLKPALALSMESVEIRSGKTEIGAIKKLSIALPLWPLLQRELQIKQVELEHATLLLSPGTWPLPTNRQPKPADVTAGSHTFRWRLMENSDFILRHGSLTFATQQSPWYTVFEDANLHLKAAELTPELWKEHSITALALKGTFRANRITTKLTGFERVRMHVGFKGGKLGLSDISSHLFQGQGHGDFTLDLAKPQPVYHLNFKLQDMEASESISRLAKQGLINGPLSLSADLHWQGDSTATMLRSLGGDVQLSGDNLLLKGIDLDKTIATFEKSQHFNLVDLGAYFFVGPMGTLATKGYSFTQVTGNVGEGPSRIRHMISDWDLENGVAMAQDVALSTEHNRLALRGRLDLVNSRYQDMEFAVLDKQGCAILSQKITGPLQSPVIETLKKLAILTAPVRDALEIPRKLLGNSKCTPFYTGGLPHPDKSQR
jgi:AsmA protein